MLREDACLPQLPRHAIGVALLDEPAREPLRRHVLGDGLRVAAHPRGSQGAPVDVAGEELHVRRRVEGGGELAQEDRDRVGLLAGRAAEHPGPQLIVPALAVEELGDHLRFQIFELPAVAEELGDADQEVVEEKLGLVGTRPQDVHVGLDCVRLHHLHPALDPAQEGVGPVAVEVVTGSVAQDGGDPRQRAGQVGRLFFDQRHRIPAGEMARLERDARGNLVGRQDEVGQGRRAVRGGEVPCLGVGGLLGEREAASLLDGGDAERAVLARARQNEADRRPILVLGEREKEAVDDPAPTGRLLGGPRPEPAPVHGQDHVGGGQVDPPGLDRRAVHDGLERARPLAKGAPERVLVEGLPVLQGEDHGQPGVGRQLGQHAHQGFRRGRGRANG